MVGASRCRVCSLVVKQTAMRPSGSFWKGPQDGSVTSVSISQAPGTTLRFATGTTWQVFKVFHERYSYPITFLFCRSLCVGHLSWASVGCVLYLSKLYKKDYFLFLMLVIIFILHKPFLLFQDQHSVVGQGAGPTPSSSSCSNPNTGSGYMNSSQQSMLNQQLMEKKQALQRQMMEQKQLLLQQQMLAEAVSFPIPYFIGKKKKKDFHGNNRKES